MTTENPEQELDSLALRKKARRRLVGTIALVLLSLIILPNLLVNKSQPIQQEAPVVLMPENNQIESIDSGDPVVIAEAPASDAFDVEASAKQLALDNAEEVVIAAPESTKSAVAESEPVVMKQAPAKQEQTEPVVVKPKEKEIKVEPKVAEKPIEKAKQAVIAKKKVEEKPVEKKVKVAVTDPKPTKPTPKKTEAMTTKTHSGYAVQVGVFGDAKNVERMKAKIALAGFESITSNFVRDGKRLTRLRVGYFISRKGAENALNTLKENNLPGAVVSR